MLPSLSDTKTIELRYSGTGVWVAVAVGVCVAGGTRVLVGTSVGILIWLVGVSAGGTGLEARLGIPSGAAAWEGLQALNMSKKKEAKRNNFSYECIQIRIIQANY